MPSKVDIANRAIRMVGGTPITSFDQGTPNANIVSDMFDALVVELLRYPWNFATVREKLAQLSEVPEFEFDHAYALPSDWIYTVSVHGDNIGRATIFFREELTADQNALLTSEDQVYLRYVKLITDPNLMAPDFVTALTRALARDIAIPISQSNTLFELMAAGADRALAKARSTDGITSFPEMRPRGSWASVRGNSNYRDGGFDQ